MKKISNILISGSALVLCFASLNSTSQLLDTGLTSSNASNLCVYMVMLFLGYLLYKVAFKK